MFEEDQLRGLWGSGQSPGHHLHRGWALQAQWWGSEAGGEQGHYDKGEGDRLTALPGYLVFETTDKEFKIHLQVSIFSIDRFSQF